MSDKTANIEVSQTLDITADVCPYTLVKSRLALEALESGQVLEVHVGNMESASNVPRSLDLEGHEVLDIQKPEATRWVIKIQRS